MSTDHSNVSLISDENREFSTYHRSSSSPKIRLHRNETKTRLTLANLVYFFWFLEEGVCFFVENCDTRPIPDTRGVR